ncbi:hypothetical protein KA005_22870 [bacterium]|nr:hypothetical protein [bacterium]
MIELLKELGIPTLSVVFLIMSLAILKELLFIMKALRQKGAELVLEKELKEIDARIEEFYMPLRERFQITKLINETANDWHDEGIFQNSALNIKSDNSQALRDILVRRIFLPINNEIKNILMDKLHWKHPDDPTNYEYIIQHFILWDAFESAKSEKKIIDYEGEHLLIFPASEVDKQKDMCTRLLKERDGIRYQLKEFRPIQPKRRISNES